MLGAFAELPYNENSEASRSSFLERVARYSSTKPHFRLILVWNQGAVVELATSATHRRNGVAAALLTSLVKNLPYSTAVFEADAAQRFYRGQGWTQIATGLGIEESQKLCVFGLRLDETSRE